MSCPSPSMPSEDNAVDLRLGTYGSEAAHELHTRIKRPSVSKKVLPAAFTEPEKIWRFEQMHGKKGMLHAALPGLRTPYSVLCCCPPLAVGER
jgi:hypothetical protein